MSWIDCVVNNDYEINTSYPHQIRKKSNGKIIKESINNNGYVACVLNKKPYLKHRIIAIQFIPNPNKFEQVDHINTVKTDNNISNLRWVDFSTNMKNKTSYRNHEAIYVDELPNGSIQILNHNGFIFNDYYIDREANVYRFNGARYFKLYINSHNAVSMRDITNKQHEFSMNGLIKAFL